MRTYTTKNGITTISDNNEIRVIPPKETVTINAKVTKRDFVNREKKSVTEVVFEYSQNGFTASRK